MNKIIQDKLTKVGVKVTPILLPKDGVDLTKWSVVACDQYTSDPEYWKQVENLVGVNPSTLNLVLPEIYLESPDKMERVNKINLTMQKYLDEGIVTEKFEGMVLVERSLDGGQIQGSARTRKGLIMALDLEKYDFHKGSKTLIRATEGTVESRIPPRLEIRKNALIEIPHIMVLIDDPNKTVIESLFSNEFPQIYDFDLMMNGGHLKGWKITDEAEIEKIADNLAKLISSDGLLFAMGDGNHSLATAKAYWQNLKVNLLETEIENHPARYALVEIVNVHDEGLEFEPIHRVIFNVDKNKLEQYLVGEGKEVELVIDGVKKIIKIKEMGSNLPVGDLQMLLDKYVVENPEAKIDYIHGSESVLKLSVENNVGILLKGMRKEELFATVEKDGALPRKTFSMGEAEEKRYYLESKAIK
jgi:uncharacterized protein (DUF1015 family)